MEETVEKLVLDNIDILKSLQEQKKLSIKDIGLSDEQFEDFLVIINSFIIFFPDWEFQYYLSEEIYNISYLIFYNSSLPITNTRGTVYNITDVFTRFELIINTFGFISFLSPQLFRSTITFKEYQNDCYIHSHSPCRADYWEFRKFCTGTSHFELEYLTFAARKEAQSGYNNLFLEWINSLTTEHTLGSYMPFERLYDKVINATAYSINRSQLEETYNLIILPALKRGALKFKFTLVEDKWFCLSEYNREILLNFFLTLPEEIQKIFCARTDGDRLYNIIVDNRYLLYDEAVRFNQEESAAFVFKQKTFVCKITNIPEKNTCLDKINIKKCIPLANYVFVRDKVHELLINSLIYNK